MFNTTNYNSKVVAVTKEIEKTISPDKVVEMYDAIREQVENDVIRTVFVKDNKLSGVAIELHSDFAKFQRKILYRFTLNGKEYLKTDFEVEENLSEEKVAHMLYEHYRDTLAGTLVKESVTAIMNGRIKN